MIHIPRPSTTAQADISQHIATVSVSCLMSHKKTDTIHYPHIVIAQPLIFIALRNSAYDIHKSITGMYTSIASAFTSVL